MSIKSDKWIRRMALEYGMIEPFEPNQIKEVDGRKVVSYGTSSYGYDIRCSDEFKIFTNINTTIVDPKNFDPKSFVDFKGEVCIIPPNSFALARTVEYFRIPRNVLTICLGKCVTGDTRVVDVETGAYVPITEMAWGRRTLAMKDWRLEPAGVSDFIPQGVKPVYELATKAGLRIRATANHPFRQLHGWTPLSELKPGDRIAAARYVPVFGRTPLADWEAVLLGLLIGQGQCPTPDPSWAFAGSDPVLGDLLARCIEQGGLGADTNRPRRGGRRGRGAGRGSDIGLNGAVSWLAKYGLNATAGAGFVPQAVFMAPRHSVRLFLQALFSGGALCRFGESFALEYRSSSRRLIEDVHHLLLRFGVFSLMRDEQTETGIGAYGIQITDREEVLRFAQEIGFWPGSIQQVRLEREILPALRAQARRLSSRFDMPAHAARKLPHLVAAQPETSLRSISLLGTPLLPALSCALARRVEASAGDGPLRHLAPGPMWDVVERITPAGEAEVFDITVPRLHNFLANGLVVHNSTYARCGIIVNVTPFEPEWEGYVTLEFSNTTPLPAKIYANEGVAQVVFFEADEECDVSYKDRGGKYQGQKGVTPPKI